MKSKLFQQLIKIETLTMDHQHYLERLKSYNEGEWFYPTNSLDNQDFQICSDLNYWNLIQKMNQPLWSDGGFRGQRIYFRYKLDLDYTEANNEPAF